MIYAMIKQGDSDSEVIICFGIKSKLSVIESYDSFGIYLTSLS